MLLIELAQKAKNIGFTIGADDQGLKLIPFTDKARAMCKNMHSIKCIDNMHNLQIIIDILRIESKRQNFKAI